MSDIFISYASEDRPRAELLAHTLETLGWSVWWDRTIPAGKRFDVVIDEAINNARSMIVLWSRISITKDWVLEEAAEGRDRHILVPALIEHVSPPRGFRRIQAADLTEWEGRDSASFQELVRAIEGVLGPSPMMLERQRREAEAQTKRETEEDEKQREQEARGVAAEPVPREPTEPSQRARTEEGVARSHRVRPMYWIGGAVALGAVLAIALTVPKAIDTLRRTVIIVYDTVTVYSADPTLTASSPSLRVGFSARDSLFFEVNTGPSRSDSLFVLDSTGVEPRIHGTTAPGVPFDTVVLAGLSVQHPLSERHKREIRDLGVRQLIEGRFPSGTALVKKAIVIPHGLSSDEFVFIPELSRFTVEPGRDQDSVWVRVTLVGDSADVVEELTVLRWSEGANRALEEQVKNYFQSGKYSWPQLVPPADRAVIEGLLVISPTVPR